MKLYKRVTGTKVKVRSEPSGALAMVLYILRVYYLIEILKIFYKNSEDVGMA